MDIFSNLIESENIPDKYKELLDVQYIQHRCTYKDVKEVIQISERTYYRRKKQLALIIKTVWQETKE